ncbi:MAG: hypothetical protein HOP19_22235 [Acidobacteria bacterium]|nr:hypothetical protein [Acidobacteriota bacterium]
MLLRHVAAGWQEKEEACPRVALRQLIKTLSVNGVNGRGAASASKRPNPVILSPGGEKQTARNKSEQFGTFG